jgi:transcriptional regulator with PAS, ATPase and Fis domain
MVDFLDSLDAPVVVVDPAGNVISANKNARELLQKELSEIEGYPGGIVFECAFAKLPEGCGKTLHCDGCTIRNTVMDTFRSGKSHLRTPAGLTRGATEENREIQFLISTEKVKDVVLLRIDKIGSDAE